MMATYRFSKRCNLTLLAEEIWGALALRVMARFEGDGVVGYLCGDDRDISVVLDAGLNKTWQGQLAQIVIAHIYRSEADMAKEQEQANRIGTEAKIASVTDRATRDALVAVLGMAVPAGTSAPRG